MNLTINQWLGITVGVLGVFGSVTGQLTDLFGAVVAKDVSSLASILTSIAGVFVTVLAGQGGQIKAVQAMPGVDKIVVNKQANSTLAQLTIDPAQTKIEAAPGAEAAITATAHT